MKEEFDKKDIFGLGNTNDAFAQYFIGQSYLNPLTKKEDYVPIANVTFEPNCRNNWHIHNTKYPVGQILIAVNGLGVYQEEGTEPVIMKPGDIIEIPSGVKHWHGSFPGHWFSHLAFSLPDEESSTEWLEEVNDEEYNKLKERV